MTLEKHQSYTAEDIANNYKNKGFYIGPTLFQENEISYLRELLEIAFSKKNYPLKMSLFDTNEPEIIKTITKAFNSEWIQMALEKLSESCGTSISVLPPFYIHRNYHVDRFKAPGIGWHRDCGGEITPLIKIYQILSILLKFLILHYSLHLYFIKQFHLFRMKKDM